MTGSNIRTFQNWDQTEARFHVVLGNEACDIDSMVCSLVYAYFLSKVKASGNQCSSLDPGSA